MEDFEKFLGLIFRLPRLPKRKKKRERRKKVELKPMAVQPDELLLENSKPFRFSRAGAKRPIEKRKR